MAENVAITPGTGDVVGADDISSVKYQRVKIIQGADGVNDGDVSSSAPLQVTLANTGANATAVVVDGSASTQPISGTVTATSGTAANLKAEVTGATAGSGTATGAIRVELPQTVQVL